jgi:anti-sigma28 factor (negative regulator of flagellin synthesis)
MEKLIKNKHGQWVLEKASLMNDTCKAEEPHKDDPDHEKKEQEKAKDIKAKAQEILDMHKDENGSLEKDAADPKFAPKEVKVKQLKAQVTAGTYKPDSKKIAEKIVERVKLNKGGQWSFDGGDA